MINMLLFHLAHIDLGFTLYINDSYLFDVGLELI